MALACPALIVQGERDPFGARGEVEAMRLSPAIRLHWAGDGDHDLGPRGASGFTRKGNLAAAADAIAEFALLTYRGKQTEKAGLLGPCHALAVTVGGSGKRCGSMITALRMMAADTASTRNSASKPQFS